jgi:hypothetical protein
MSFKYTSSLLAAMLALLATALPSAASGDTLANVRNAALNRGIRMCTASHNGARAV